MMAPTKAEIHLRGEKEVDFTHSQPRRLFESLPTINLENKEISSAEREREVNSNHFRLTMNLGNKKRFIWRKKRSWLNLLAIKQTVQIMVDG